MPASAGKTLSELSVTDKAQFTFTTQVGGASRLRPVSYRLCTGLWSWGEGCQPR